MRDGVHSLLQRCAYVCLSTTQGVDCVSQFVLKRYGIGARIKSAALLQDVRVLLSHRRCSHLNVVVYARSVRHLVHQSSKRVFGETLVFLYALLLQILHPLLSLRKTCRS